MTTATSVVLVIAIIAMTANRVVMKSVAIGRMPALDHLEQGGVGARQRVGGTVSAAAIETST